MSQILKAVQVAKVEIYSKRVFHWRQTDSFWQYQCQDCIGQNVCKVLDGWEEARKAYSKGFYPLMKCQDTENNQHPFSSKQQLHELTSIPETVKVNY